MKIFTIILTVSFLIFAAYCYKYHPLHYAKTQPVDIWRNTNAAIIADIYNINPAEIDKPINIFKE